MSKLDKAIQMMEALQRDAKFEDEVPRLLLRLSEVLVLLQGIKDEGGVTGDVESMTNEVLLGELKYRLLRRSEGE